MPARPPRRPLLLALDTGSPLVSAAVAEGPRVLAEGAVEIDRSSGALLDLVDRCLGEAGADAADLCGILALQGPGSFTGLRVGLATVLGLHAALGAPATALPTLQVLASLEAREGATVAAVVDALRGEWFVQKFRAGPRPAALSAPRLASPREIAALAAETVVGFGVTRLQVAASFPAETAVSEPGPLAGAALRLAARASPTWDLARLTRPLYLRPPAVTPPRGDGPPGGPGGPPR